MLGEPWMVYVKTGKTQWEYLEKCISALLMLSCKSRHTFFPLYAFAFSVAFLKFVQQPQSFFFFFTKASQEDHIYANSILIQHQLPWFSIFALSWSSVLSLPPLSHQILSMPPKQIELLFTTTSEMQLISSPDGGPVRHSLPQMHIFSSSSLHSYINHTLFKHLQHLSTKLFINKQNYTINCSSSYLPGIDRNQKPNRTALFHRATLSGNQLCLCV